MRATVMILPVVLGFVVPGCESTMEYKEMTEVEKAAHITKLRKQAGEALSEFERSEGQDLESLQKHVELQRETTKVSPGSCPLCFYNYGVALSRLGLYYHNLARLFEAEAGKAANAAEKKESQEKAAKYTGEMRKNLVLSNRQFDIYFSSGEAIDPRAYFWVYRQYQQLGDFRQARGHLDLYVANVALTAEERKAADDLRRELDEQARRQDEDDLRREMEEADAAENATRGARKLPEMAN